MLVKAKWNVKDSAGWHRANEVFETEEDLGDGVEVLTQEAQKKVQMPEVQDAEPERTEEPAKPRTRRKVSK